MIFERPALQLLLNWDFVREFQGYWKLSSWFLAYMNAITTGKTYDF